MTLNVDTIERTGPALSISIKGLIGSRSWPELSSTKKKGLCLGTELKAGAELGIFADSSGQDRDPIRP